MPSRAGLSSSDEHDTRARLHPTAVLALLVTVVSAAMVALTASDIFTRLTMLAGLGACILLWQSSRDVLVILTVTTLILGAVLGWGLAFYDRIWWYDDFIHFLFSFVGVMGVARVTLHRFRAETVPLLLGALWLSWLGVGALWEIGEWTSDRLQATHHSRGYADTMSDMILNSLGAALGTWTYWRLLRTSADRDIAPA